MREDVTADKGDVLERRQETAPVRGRRFGHISRRCAVLAPSGEALHEASEDQNHGRPVPEDSRVGMTATTKEQVDMTVMLSISAACGRGGRRTGRRTTTPPVA